VTTTCTEDGHKQTTKTSTTIQTKKDEGTLDDRGRDGGTKFILRIKEEETRLTLQEHNDDESFKIYLKNHIDLLLYDSVFKHCHHQ